MSAANVTFFGQMALSSALTLLRGFALAQILEPAAFGTYATILAVGIFGGSLLSFGRIEQTNKRFPRLFADGHAREALAEADNIARLLVPRAVVAGTLAAAAAALLALPGGMAGALGATGLALAAAWQSTYASVHRASGELITLAHAGTFRTISALILATAGGHFLSWQGAIAGEAVAALAGAWISRTFAQRLGRRLSNAAIWPSAANNDLWLFAAFLVGAIPVYLDRLFVSSLYGAVAAGQYGILMLFVGGGTTLMTIIVQKLGPELVRLQHSRTSFRRQLAVVSAWIVGAITLIVLGMGTASYLLLMGPLTALANKYQIVLESLIVTTLISSLQVTVILDWLLLSHDRERLVFAATSTYISTLAAGIAIIATGDSDWTSFLWLMMFAKMAQILLQIVFVSAFLPSGSKHHS